MEALSGNCRRHLLALTPTELLADLLNAVGNLQAVLESGLRWAAHVLRAQQALFFDDGNRMAWRGADLFRAMALRRQRLAPLLAQQASVHYSLPEFTYTAENGAPVIGMAGVVHAGRGAFVLGVERDYEPFSPEEQRLLEIILRQLARPLHCTVEVLEARGELRYPKTFTAHQLPLQELDPLPPIKQVEMLLIQEAMRRSGNNKTIAAAWLGITREGLRRKLERMQIALSGLRPDGHPA